MNTQTPKKLMLRCYSKNRPIRATYSTALTGSPLHSHDYYEIEIIISGEAIHNLNSQSYKIKPGTAYILNPSSFHSYEIIKPLKLFCINFDGSVIPEKLFFKMNTVGASRQIEISDERLQDIIKLGEILVKECKKKDGGCSVEICECILAMLFEQVENSNPNPDKFDVGMQKALLYLNSHFFESPSLAEVAREANYHKNYFSEMFKQCFGQTYSSMLNELKVNYAKVLLATGFSVSEACFRSGFRSLSSFLSVFKEKEGISPKKFKDRELASKDANTLSEQ